MPDAMISVHMPNGKIYVFKTANYVDTRVAGIYKLYERKGADGNGEGWLGNTPISAILQTHVGPMDIQVQAGIFE
jgi:hypothetical protein